LCFLVGAGRPVEERLLQLSPSTLECDPRVCRPGGRIVARDRLDDREELGVRGASVVAPDAGVRGASQPERRAVLVRVRAA
jgi:hypothetical protein